MTAAVKAWIIILAAVLVVDVWLEVTGRETLTEAVRRLSPSIPLIPVFGGLLVAHFWWRN